MNWFRSNLLGLAALCVTIGGLVSGLAITSYMTRTNAADIAGVKEDLKNNYITKSEMDARSKNADIRWAVVQDENKEILGRLDRLSDELMERQAPERR